jgi:UDP-N-acetylmuramate dehydrogenase
MGQHLAAVTDGGVAFDRPLAPLTTYRLGGPAAILFEPASEPDLLNVSRALRDAGLTPDELPLLVVGRGSNVVISDRGFDGLVIRMGSAMSWTQGSNDPASPRVTAGAATSMPLLANWAARRSLAGLEFTVGIPGSVGGGVRMNAGAHEGSISDTLSSAHIYRVGSETIEEREAVSLGLSYRRSSLGPDEVVTSASFALRADDDAAIRARMERYRKHRADTQPGALQNAGSTFKNPPGDSAGRLVEAAGLKGHSVGGAHVSELHANFFIAGDGATAQDVFDLVHLVKARVAEMFDVELEPEVRFVGPFDRSMSSTGASR